MSVYCDYNGVISFNSIEAADKVKAKLVTDGWLVEYDDILVWVDECGSPIDIDDEDDSLNKMGELSLTLEKSSRRNIRPIISKIISLDIDIEKTIYRASCLDGQVSAWYWDQSKGVEVSLTDNEIASVVKIDENGHKNLDGWRWLWNS